MRGDVESTVKPYRPVVVALMSALTFRILLAAQAAPDTGAPVTFRRDIAPILFDHCASCHRPDGAAPFSLLTYDDARQHARQIVAVTESRYMPPWKPEAGYGEFENERRLNDAQVGLIARWASDGAAEGDSPLPTQPQWAPGWQLGEPDLVVSVPEYVLRPDGTDVFRNFVVHLPGAGVHYVRGVEFRPGSRAIHHANIRVDPTPASRQLDDADPEPGYSGVIANSAEYPDGHFNGWTPGQVPSLAPKELAWPLQVGTDLVVNLHLRPTGKPERIDATIGFFFTNDAPTRTPANLRMGRQNIDIPAGESAYRSSDRYALPVDAEFHVVQPHAHYRPRELKTWAVLPDGSVRWLLYIRTWDFNWQEQYRYHAPFWLPAGTTLFSEYVFDNSASNPQNPDSPPRRVSWGFGSADEMADVWFQVFTRTDAELARLKQDVRLKMATEDAVGYEALLKADPDNADLHDDAALLYVELKQSDQALAHFEAAMRLRPGSASAHYNVGTVLEGQEKKDAAAARYEEAIRLDPDYALAHNNLGNIILERGNTSDAIRHYRDAIQAKPDYAEAHNNLATVLLIPGIGPIDEAIAHLQEALRLQPRYPAARFNLARALRQTKNTRDAVVQYQEALKDSPACTPCLIELAWMLGTNPDGQIRNPPEAVRLATRAVEITRSRDALALDALGCAYAAAGRFDDAITTEIHAADLASGGSTPNMIAAQIRERLDLFRRSMSYVDADR
jgi:tetratricopeptide (TPR) repeat protein/mono/diheme cytochrome c family protein